MNGYKINFVDNTITITADFAKAMNDPKSKEYKTIAKICKDFPEMELIRKTHRSPRKYTNKQGEEFNCNQFKNLTYDRMEKFINAIPNNEAFLTEFEFVRDYASRIQTNGYALVRRWFMAQFPEFRNNPMFYLYNTPNVINATDMFKAAEQEAEEKEVA